VAKFASLFKCVFYRTEEIKFYENVKILLKKIRFSIKIEKSYEN